MFQPIANIEDAQTLAQAIVKAAAARGLDVPRAEAFEAVPGHGLLATVDGRRLAVGNARLLERFLRLFPVPA